MGAYCPGGTPTPVDCPEGTFNNGTGLANQLECSKCSPGMFCFRSGLTWPSGKCDERYFCELGAIHAKPNYPNGGNCTKGHYCPVGTKLPLPCKVNQFFYKCLEYKYDRAATKFPEFIPVDFFNLE